MSRNSGPRKSSGAPGPPAHFKFSLHHSAAALVPAAQQRYNFRPLSLNTWRGPLRFCRRKVVFLAARFDGRNVDNKDWRHFFSLCRICILCILYYRLFICLIMIGTKKEKKKGGRRVHTPHNFLVFCIFILLNIFLLKCQKKITSLFQNVQLLYNKRAFLCYGIEIY